MTRTPAQILRKPSHNLSAEHALLCPFLAWGRSGKEGAGCNRSGKEKLFRMRKDEAEGPAVGMREQREMATPMSPAHHPPPTGARPPVSPAPCQGVPCPLQCLCVCASRTGAACTETSPSGTCRTQSSQPSAQAAALSGESQSHPCPPCLTVQAAGSLTGPDVPSVAAGPSLWLVNVSTWYRMYQWQCTTLAGSPR